MKTNTKNIGITGLKDFDLSQMQQGGKVPKTLDNFTT